MSDLSESSNDNNIQSDEEQSEEEFVTHTAVLGYQYEPKKKNSDENEPKSSEAAGGSGLVDRRNRVGNTNWFVQLYTSFLFQTSLKWLTTIICVSSMS